MSAPNEEQSQDAKKPAKEKIEVRRPVKEDNAFSRLNSEAVAKSNMQMNEELDDHLLPRGRASTQMKRGPIKAK